MANENQKYVLITGATSGIGYEFTKLFARDGYNLVIVARSKDRLDEISRDWKSKYAVDVIPIAKDLFNPTAPREVYDELKEKGINISVLVNDAGQGSYGFFHQTDLQRDLEIIQLNIVTLV